MRVRGSCRELKNQGFYCCGMWQHQGSAKRIVFSGLHESLTSCTPSRHFLLYLYLLHVCGCVCSHIPNQSTNTYSSVQGLGAWSSIIPPRDQTDVLHTKIMDALHSSKGLTYYRFGSLRIFLVLTFLLWLVSLKLAFDLLQIGLLKWLSKLWRFNLYLVFGTCVLSPPQLGLKC